MGTHPIFESDFDCLTEIGINTAQWDHVLKFFKRQTRLRRHRMAVRRVETGPKASKRHLDRRQRNGRSADGGDDDIGDRDRGGDSSTTTTSSTGAGKNEV